jgi:inward rectifier potassium channel
MAVERFISTLYAFVQTVTSGSFMPLYEKKKPIVQPRRRLVPRNQDILQVVRIGHKKFWFTDLYVHLLSMPWIEYAVLIAALYFLSNVGFALIYWDDAAGIENARSNSFLDMYFFSVQTMATIGYGRMSPIDVITNIVVTVEALWGFTFFAFATGLAFARFSRPTARVLFSDIAVISNYEGQPHLKIRVANQRTNRIVDVKVTLVMLHDGPTKEGYRMRRFYDLPLVRDSVPLLQLSWTIMHPIDKHSPLFNITQEKLRADGDEIIISLSGHDETLSQTIHARHSFLGDEIICGAFFKDILRRYDNGTVEVNYTKFHEWEEEKAT